METENNSNSIEDIERARSCKRLEEVRDRINHFTQEKKAEEKELSIALIGHAEEGRRPYLVDVAMLKNPTTTFSEVAREIKNDIGEVPQLRIYIPIPLMIF